MNYAYFVVISLKTDSKAEYLDWLTFVHIHRIHSEFFFFTKVHLIQGPRATQDRELLNEVCDINMRGESWK